MVTSVFPKSEKQNGQATVEFALVLPLFLATLLGLVFVSILLFSFVTLQLAVRQGSHELVYNTNDTIYSVRKLVCDNGFAFAPANLTVRVEPPDSATGGLPCSSLNTSEGSASGLQAGITIAVTGIYTVPLPKVSMPVNGGAFVIFGPIPIMARSVETID